MVKAIAIRTDYTIGEVRGLAKRAKDAAQARWLLAIPAVPEGPRGKMPLRGASAVASRA